MSYKLVISKETKNALTETDPDNLIFSSEYNTLKYYTSGTINLNVTADPYEYEYKRTSSFSHDLGYYPFYVVYVKDDIISNYQPVGRFQAGSGAVRSFYSYVTTTQLVVIAFGNAGLGGENYTAVFKYKIFKNNLDL